MSWTALAGLLLRGKKWRAPSSTTARARHDGAGSAAGEVVHHAVVGADGRAAAGLIVERQRVGEQHELAGAVEALARLGLVARHRTVVANERAAASVALAHHSQADAGAVALGHGVAHLRQ